MLPFLIVMVSYSPIDTTGTTAELSESAATQTAPAAQAPPGTHTAPATRTVLPRTPATSADSPTASDRIGVSDGG